MGGGAVTMMNREVEYMIKKQTLIVMNREGKYQMKNIKCCRRLLVGVKGYNGKRMHMWCQR